MANPADGAGPAAAPGELRIGTGVDVHRLVPGRPLMLGGVEIDHLLGLEGHSDADVLAHAITDAVLGALGRRDIGFHYPPGEERWRGYPGVRFLEDMRDLLAASGWAIVNVDSVIVAERPKLGPHIPRMMERVAGALGVEPARVGIKAKTFEGLGLTGREEGIMAQAVVLLQKAR
jgi:2-C-methyl-D-erythritol 2,4-cyclodiphosphate synthase